MPDTNIEAVTTQGGMHIESSSDGTIARSQHIEGVTQDKPNEQNPDGGALGGDPRKDAMAAIIAKRNTVLQGELDHMAALDQGATVEAIEQPENNQGQNPTEASQPREKTVDKPVAKTVEQPNENQPEAIERPHQRVLNIGGREIPVTDDEMNRLAAAGFAANQQVTEALRLRDEAQRIAQQAMYRQPQQQIQQPQQSGIDENRLREVSKKFSFGTEDEQVKALRDLVEVAAQSGQRTHQGPSPQELVGYATQNAMNQIRYEQSLHQLGQEFPDVFADPYLSEISGRMAKDLNQKYQALGVAKNIVELGREVGAIVRDKYMAKQAAQTAEAKTTNSSVQSANNVTDFSARLERKRAAPQPPAAASKIAHERTKGAPSGSDIVSQMRKSRGQPN